jgi:hypothetical protein
VKFAALLLLACEDEPEAEPIDTSVYDGCVPDVEVGTCADGASEQYRCDSCGKTWFCDGDADETWTQVVEPPCHCILPDGTADFSKDGCLEQVNYCDAYDDPHDS